MYQLILASESPRRKQLLSEAGFQFEIRPSYVSEFLEKNLTVKEQILSLARRKASFVFSQMQTIKSEPFIVLGSDTMVVIDGVALGKPESSEQAFQFLKKLSGQEHEVMTAICMIESTQRSELSQIETTRVRFKKLSDEAIWSYVQSGEPMDKAGAYAIQGGGGQFVETITGDIDTVVGLPIKAVQTLWSQFHSPIFLNYSRLQKEVSDLSNGRCQILAVSKLQGKEKILKLADLNVKNFAENYIQEALDKITYFKSIDEKYSSLNWHMIGHLQKNKVKFLKNNFYLIHSVDSIDLAETINKKNHDLQNTRAQKVLLQVNLANEKTKGGFDEDEIFNLAPQLFSLKNIEICGLMTMPPLNENPELNRKYFKRLKQILNELQKMDSTQKLTELSMGTTSDYRVAIEEGSTWVRLGTILFGERPTR